MVLVVFRSRLRAEAAEEFGCLAEEMLGLARAMPGFVSYTSFRAEDGERCSVIEFETPEALRAWREHPRHREAQEQGRARFYQEYTLHVADETRTSRFRHEPGEP
jgi:heme-degrading monooxygenase HmoA